MKRCLYAILLLLLSGCLIPVPHKRVSRVGCEGIVRDACTGSVIEGAEVTVSYGGVQEVVYSDEQGYFHVKDEQSWHGAFFIGIPISLSLFPSLDAPALPLGVVVRNQNYANYSNLLWKKGIHLKEGKCVVEVRMSKLYEECDHSYHEYSRTLGETVDSLR